MTSSVLQVQTWKSWQKILFRFSFLFFFFFITPLFFIEQIPGVSSLTEFVYKGIDAMAAWFNSMFFHMKHAVKPPNGNGDYPEQWMSLFTYLTLSVIGTIVWSILDRRRAAYTRLNYWLCLGLRFFVIATGIGYGTIKIFALQMPYPNISQMATPLGDFLPMRFSWMFIGYSHSYQVFSGVIELLAAVLLLFRRTATLGVLVSLGVFFNVMMLNLSYDIPVKINSIFIVLVCFYLLILELPRLFKFFFRNEAEESVIFVFPFITKRGRVIAVISKWLFIGLLLFGNFTMITQGFGNTGQKSFANRIPPGFYDVVQQVIKNDTIGLSFPDSVYWQNIVFEETDFGSIKTTDNRFRQRYGRGYFNFTTDSTGNIISIRKNFQDTLNIVQFSWQKKDSVLYELRSYPNADSLYFLLRKKSKPFPLSENQFHWISETNR